MKATTMPQFHLDTWTQAKVRHINKRTELHGQEIVHAQDIDWCIEVPNTVLDEWWPGLRDALYTSANNGTLAGIEPTTPNLRTEQLKHPYSMKIEYTGYTVTVDRGLGDRKSNLELQGCNLTNFKLDPKAGGTCVVTFRSQSSGLDGETLGRVDLIDGHEVQVTMLMGELSEDELEGGDFTPPDAGDIFGAVHSPAPAKSAKAKKSAKALAAL